MGAHFNDVVARFMQRAAPCDGCPHAPRCKAEELACRRFVQYIKLKRWANVRQTLPTRERYRQAYRGGVG